MKKKVTIIGAGSVGATTAFALLTRGAASEVVLIDINTDKALGEALDIKQATPFIDNCDIYAGSYRDAVDSDVVIITSGIGRKPGQTRLELVQTNTSIIKSIANEIVKYAPNAIYILVANPGVAVAGTNREFIHALFARRVYVKSATDLTPTDEVEALADTGIDLYNMNTANYYAMFTEGFITPVATALIYPDLAINDAGEEAAAKWGKSYSNFAMQYQAPAKGEHLSKFVPLEGDREKYMALYAGDETVLSGIASEYTGYGANSTVLVPVSSAYPTDYIAQNHNSAGRVTALMLIPELVPGEE